MLGWPKSKRLHALRHLAAIAIVEAEYNKLLKEHPHDPAIARKNLSITIKDKLGHLSDEAQLTYITYATKGDIKELSSKKIESAKIEVQKRVQEQLELLEARKILAQKSKI